MGKSTGLFFYTAVIAILYLFPCDVKSQIAPPDLQCIKGDTIIWSLPAESCGPFLSYDIYASQDPNGPFTLLFSVTDPTETFAIHPNSPGIWYYYMISLFDCPGLISVSSDTLDNRSPLEPDILVATVEDNEVYIEWVPSISSQVIGHIIYRATSSGTVPIDTVYLPGNSYTDTSADINNQAEFYYVLALDHCGNTSGFIKFHKTIFMEVTQDPCERSFIIDWEEYQGFSQGIENYELSVTENGILTRTIDVTGDTGRASRLSGIENETEYCLTITGKENHTGIVTNSNTVCITGEIRIPLSVFDYTAFTIAGNELLLEFEYNEDYEFTEFYIATGYTRDFSSPGIITVTTTSGPGIHSAALPYNESAALPLFVAVSSLDVCGNITLQDTLKSIYLSGKSNPDSTNDLIWDELVWPEAGIISYELNFLSGTPPQSLFNGPVANEVFIHNFNNRPGSDDGYCYQVAAHTSISTASGTRNITSHSNIECVEQESVIFMANAFTPGGSNPAIAPVIRYPESVADYTFTVFDRYGSLVYQSTVLQEGWRGSDMKGRPLQPGVYAYLVSITLHSGKRSTLKGTILLLR